MRSRSRALSLARERAPSMHAYMHAEGSGRVGSRAAYACMYACPRDPWAPDTHSATAAARRRMGAIVRGRGRILGKPHHLSHTQKKFVASVRVFMRTGLAGVALGYEPHKEESRHRRVYFHQHRCAIGLVRAGCCDPWCPLRRAPSCCCASCPATPCCSQ